MADVRIQSALLGRFQLLERKLQDLGLYKGPIDTEWGDGVDSALEALFEKAGWRPRVESSIYVTPSFAELHSKLRAFAPAYRWLADEEQLPRIVQAAILELGTKEQAGAGNNPELMSWRSALERAGKEVSAFTADAVPWCGLGTGWIALQAGYKAEIPRFPLWALNWSKFGVPAKQPCLGAVCTFVRDKGGHVGIYIGEDHGFYHILGCNQSDAVTIARIAKTRLHACREPAYKVRPAAARPFVLAPTGSVFGNDS